MKALVLDENNVMSISSQTTPQLTHDNVLVKLKASSLNHREIWISKGLYPGMKLPCILGADGTGIVEKIGSNVDEKWLNAEVILYPAYAWGDDQKAPSREFRVLGMPDPGTIAEYISIPATNLVLKPAYLSWLEAAAIPVASLTAWRALTHLGAINEKSKVLITGIGGGVAQAGLSFAKAKNAKVYVTSSSEEKINFAKKNGAINGVNYRDEHWHEQVKEISGGIDIVLDSSPSPILDDYFKFMNYGGRIITYGSTGSRKTTINISKFFLRHIQFIGTAMGSPKEFEEMINFMEIHQIKPIINSFFPFDKAIEAINELSLGHQIGKIVLDHSQ